MTKKFADLLHYPKHVAISNIGNFALFYHISCSNWVRYYTELFRFFSQTKSNEFAIDKDLLYISYITLNTKKIIRGRFVFYKKVVYELGALRGKIYLVFMHDGMM